MVALDTGSAGIVARNETISALVITAGIVSSVVPERNNRVNPRGAQRGRVTAIAAD
jgi:hypothetical protein